MLTGGRAVMLLGDGAVSGASVYLCDDGLRRNGTGKSAGLPCFCAQPKPAIVQRAPAICRSV